MKACVNAVLLCFCNVCSLSQGGNFVPRIYCGPINAGDLLKGRPDSRRGGKGAAPGGAPLCAPFIHLSPSVTRERRQTNCYSRKRFTRFEYALLRTHPYSRERTERTGLISIPSTIPLSRRNGLQVHCE